MAKKKIKSATATPSKVRPFKSPIETMMRNAIVNNSRSHGVNVWDNSTSRKRAYARFVDGVLVFNEREVDEFRNRTRADGTYGSEVHDGHYWDVDPMYQTYELVEGGGFYLTLYADVVVGTYRVDLLAVLQGRGGGESPLAIECDGHDFHNVTKQQAASDRSRDRELLALGLPTVRFTGSEIHHSVERCVNDIYAVMKSMVNKADAAEDFHMKQWQSAHDNAHEYGVKVGSEQGYSDGVSIGWMRAFDHMREAGNLICDDGEEHF